MIGRIRQREVFSRLSKEGTYVRSNGLWCLMLTDSSLQNAHVGYAIGRNVGGAVLRNRIRRQLRSLLEAKSDHLPAGWYLVGAQSRVGTMSWTDLGASVDQLVAKVAVS